MNRIEKIKEEEYYTLDGWDYKYATDDIKYLLSKLEIAEKALEKAFDAEGYSFLEEALQHIRE